MWEAQVARDDDTAHCTLSHTEDGLWVVQVGGLGEDENERAVFPPFWGTSLEVDRRRRSSAKAMTPCGTRFGQPSGSVRHPLAARAPGRRLDLSVEAEHLLRIGYPHLTDVAAAAANSSHHPDALLPVLRRIRHPVPGAAPVPAGTNRPVGG